MNTITTSSIRPEEDRTADDGPIKKCVELRRIQETEYKGRKCSASFGFSTEFPVTVQVWSYTNEVLNQYFWQLFRSTNPPLFVI